VIRLVLGDVLTAKTDALLVAMDGDAEGMEGNIGRQLQRKIGEEAWEDLMAQLIFPMGAGTAQIAEFEGVAEVQFKFAVFAAAFLHATNEGASSTLKASLDQSLKRARGAGARSIATAVLTGGWRVNKERAIAHLVDVSDSCGLEVEVYSRAKEYAETQSLFQAFGVR